MQTSLFSKGNVTASYFSNMELTFTSIESPLPSMILTIVFTTPSDIGRGFDSFCFTPSSLSPCSLFYAFFMAFGFSLTLNDKTVKSDQLLVGLCVYFGWMILSQIRRRVTKPTVNNPMGGLVKESEMIRLITQQLISLGYDDVAALLEKESGVPLYSPIIKKLLKLVEDGDWDRCIAELPRLHLRNENAVKFLLLEQKFFRVLRNRHRDARRVLIEMNGLDVDRHRVWDLTNRFLVPLIHAAMEYRKSEFMEKLRNLFPLGVIIPERRLEYLLEKSLVDQMGRCLYHNVPDSDLSIWYDHDCEGRKLPSKTVQTLVEHTDEVWFVKFSHNGRYLASASRDRSAIIWEINAAGVFLLKHKLEGHENPVVEVLWRPDDREVITCGENEVIRRWDVESGAFVRSYEINGVGAISCGWFHDGSGIIGGMEDRRICLWNLDGTIIPHEQEQRAQMLSDVAMTTDGRRIISVGREPHEISLLDRVTNNEQVIVEEDMITSFSLSKDSTHLLVNLITQKIIVWYIGLGGEPMNNHRFHGHRRSRFIIRSCFGGYKEDFVASGSEDSQVYIWQRKWNVLCGVLSGHGGAVNCVSWSPTDMQMLASGSDDGTIRIWGI